MCPLSLPFPAISFPPSRHVPESNIEPSSDLCTQVRLSTLLCPTPVPLYVRGGFRVDRLSRLGVKPTTNPPPRSTLTTMLSLKYLVSPKSTSRASRGTLIGVMLQNTRSILIVHRACTACGIRTADRLTPSPLSSGVLSWAARTKSSQSVRYTPPWRINIPGTKALVTRGRYATACNVDKMCLFFLPSLSLAICPTPSLAEPPLRTGTSARYGPRGWILLDCEPGCSSWHKASQEAWSQRRQ